jgi:hypothetical protein
VDISALDAQSPVDSRSEFDIITLMSMRERLLKMATFAGLNKECSSRLTQVKRLHWRLLHQETFSNAAMEQDDAHDYPTSSSNPHPQQPPVVSGVYSTSATASEEGTGRVCKEAPWAIAFAALTILVAIIAATGPNLYSSRLAPFTVTILGSAFLAAVAASVAVLLAHRAVLAAACPLATLGLFVLSVCITVVTPAAAPAAVAVLVVAVLVGCFGARTAGHLRAALPLFSLAQSLIRHHLSLLPLSLLAAYAVALSSHFFLSLLLHLVTDELPVDDPDSALIGLAAPAPMHALALALALLSWLWFTEVVRFSLQSLVHGLVAYHYHLTHPGTHDSAPTQPDSAVADPPCSSLAEYSALACLPAAIRVRAPPHLPLALLLRLLSHSLGSVAHGAILATPARLLHMFCRKVAKVTRSYRVRRGDGLSVRVVRRLLLLSERAYARWGKFSFRLVMIYGYGFKHASALTYAQFLDRGVDSLLQDMVVEGFVFLLAVFVAALAAVVTLTQITIGAQEQVPFTAVTPGLALLLAGAVFVSVLLAVSVVLDVLATSVVAVYAGFAENPAGLTKYSRSLAAHLQTRFHFEADAEREERMIDETEEQTGA